ncbi:PEP-CTERM sorting domain-containing protein [Rhodoferax sp. 4810]|nr:PEP-CTERM sorting domain-containing protein [Rhodoferax jenense]
MHIRGFLVFLFAAWLPIAAFANVDFNGDTATLYSYSTKEVDHITNIEENQRVDTFLVELIGLMQGSSTVLYHQTFNVAFTDPAVQAAIDILQSELTGNGATSVFGPTLLNSSSLLVGSTAEVADAIVSSAVTTIVTTYVGPQTVFIGENQGTSFTLTPGQMDIDVLVQTDSYINRTTTTTDTFLTRAVYEVDGVTAATSVPEPATLGLMALGLMAMGGVLRRKFIGRH